MYLSIISHFFHSFSKIEGLLSAQSKGDSPLCPDSSTVIHGLVPPRNKGLSLLRLSFSQISEGIMFPQNECYSPLCLHSFQIMGGSRSPVDGSLSPFHLCSSPGDRGLSKEFTPEMEVNMLSMMCFIN